MTNSTIIVRPTKDGYEIVESFKFKDSSSKIESKAFSYYYLIRGDAYLLCVENDSRDFARFGNKRKDVEDTVIGTSAQRDKALGNLAKLALEQAQKMLESRESSCSLVNEIN